MDHHFEHPSDDAVMATNDDASECKRSAVRLGYWQDEYIGQFVRNTDRRAPEINRGYFARVRGVEMCVEKFLQVGVLSNERPSGDLSNVLILYRSHRQKTGDACQIINLGCGFDTLYWRLKDGGHRVQNFVECDFPTVTSRKCSAIKRNKHLLGSIHTEDGEVRFNLTDLHAPNYHVVGVDLRNIDEVAKKLRQADVDMALPTIVLAECVLVYVEPANCATLLGWLATNFASAVLVNYEQVNMRDRFGDVMLSNLRSRGCTLAGVEACVSLESQVAR